ncbi:unnamed protein product [Cyprideis torosa]|uniref:Ribonuclease n=1 Tax=Cyprideis torosa TaxID=163714 RepID=A0A7R8ZV90_9CRUS|nr:unnamed protein product [Cyprideis torosa]CAG0907184.1 unnamed protein product [Cyprideis torosa]
MGPRATAENCVDTFLYERDLSTRGYTCIAGVDEVGRGPLAGPVVAACVSLPLDCDPAPFIDSKKTSPRQRVHLAARLREYGATVGVGIVSHLCVDRVNILQASLLAMRLAVFNHDLSRKADFLLVDGKFEIPLPSRQIPLVRGESKSASIAAASIVAKLFRDTLMERLAVKYPQYGFAQNKGYPTKTHRQAISRHGPCAIHRLSFKGVRDFV